MMTVDPKFSVLPANEYNGPEMWTFDVDAFKPAHNATCSRIYDFLYVGGFLAAENVEWLKQIGITCVVNVRKEQVQNTTSGIEYVDIAVDDDEYEPIHWYFDQAAEKIEAHRKANGRVLINCEMGISRSATICLMYMIRCQNRSLRQAYFYLKEMRPCIYPNLYFWKSMINYEKGCRLGKTSIKMMGAGWTRPIPDVYLG